MRCKNCGWPNKPNETTCSKCHSPLEQDSVGQSFGDMSGYGGTPSTPLNRTVMEDDVFGGRPSSQDVVQEPERQDEPTQSCPKCGYPTRPGTEKCPNCKFPLGHGPSRPVSSGYEPQRAEPSRPQPAPTEREEEHRHRPTRLDSSANPGKFRGTINPYMMNVEIEPTFVLKPLKRVNERHDLEDVEYEGKTVVLKRDNTEPNNPSITSREQAVVSREGDRWFIEDKSEQKTTFVQAANKIELHDGDVILLGNRLFVFHE